MVPKPPKSAKTVSVTPIKLPPLPALRVRRPNPSDKNPCQAVMASVLSCWASTGYSVEACGKLEQELRKCMDAPKSKSDGKNDINTHLRRMYPRIIGPHKRK